MLHSMGKVPLYIDSIFTVPVAMTAFGRCSWSTAYGKARSVTLAGAQHPAFTNETLAPVQSHSIGSNFLALVSNFVVNSSRTASQILSGNSEGCLEYVPAEQRPLATQPCFEAQTYPRG